MLLRGGGLQAVARTAPPLIAAAAVTVAYNLHRFGDALQFGYRPPADPGFTTPLLEGAAGLLASPEKSVVLFAPAIVLVPFAFAALWRRDRLTAALLAALFAVTFVLAAAWWSWQGGWSWGPRLLLPGVALALVALAPWIGTNARRARLAGALFVLGFALSLPAVIAPAGAQLLDRAPNSDGPQIVRQYRELPALTRHSVDAVHDRSARGRDYRRYLALWQANLVREVGAAGVAGALLGTLALLAALVAVALPLRRRLRAT